MVLELISDQIKRSTVIFYATTLPGLRFAEYFVGISGETPVGQDFQVRLTDRPFRLFLPGRQKSRITASPPASA
jgi:hypothetical protein